ncbi:hypothetical protein N7449_011357 [Penicillium cf. viridicatum]|uniref:Protein ECM13 n=1 Tax=Penicillium cf. viridicatum TaxID=2972119 RepID=A0A9W9M2I3_9EURO|nr:hypothetical protein N7449_011357 [Penicillium cf. viridicatum]
MDSPITSYLPKDSSSFASAATLCIKSPSRQRHQKKISITQTYYIAHTVRKKLDREASRADHDLRLLVGHANLLDSLMLDYADTKREHEEWFNKSVNDATKVSQKESQHIQWASTEVAEAEEDRDSEDASDLESDFSESDEDESDFDELDFVINAPIRRWAPSPVTSTPEDSPEEDVNDYTDSNFEFNDAEDLGELSLKRLPSRQSPPELLIDSDDEFEDKAGPQSLPQPTLESFNEKEHSSKGLPRARPGKHRLFGSITFHKSRVPSSSNYIVIP